MQISTMKETSERSSHSPLVNLWETALGTFQWFHLLLKEKTAQAICWDINVSAASDHRKRGKSQQQFPNKVWKKTVVADFYSVV